MAERDENRMSGRVTTESLFLRDSKDYQKGPKHLKDS